jgi:hypothetical protein
MNALCLYKGNSTTFQNHSPDDDKQSYNKQTFFLSKKFADCSKEWRNEQIISHSGLGQLIVYVVIIIFKVGEIWFV